ncbi:ATP-dependent bile acid permease, partial [Lachnellula subtilissima]
MAQFVVQDFSAPRFQGFAAYPSTFLEVDVEVEEGGVSVGGGGGGGGGCKRVWDPVNARFEPCALPLISAIPAAITLCILLGFVLQLLPTRKVTPKWLRVFIHEIPEQQEELLPKKKRYFTFLSGTLLVASLVGFVLQTVSVFRPKLRLETIYPAASWAIACLIITLQRPAKTPKALLVLYTSIFATQAIVLIDKFFSTSREDIPAILALITSLIAILIILHMPFRDPSLPRATISPAFSAPTDKLRSPEDDLTLWQFMSVSWMKPLIDLGNARQLNDEDVWSLSYEFQHRILHDRFRELKGSVLRRLLEANGLDLVIISVLSILELFASTKKLSSLNEEVRFWFADAGIDFSAPVLLQKILQSMEDHRAPKRAALTYALFSLVLRFVGSQSSVFSLWYGRRAYERSRGEMITMLYEKTLSRKVVSVSSKPEENSSTSGTNGSVKAVSRSRWGKAVEYLKKPFQSKKKAPVLESVPEKSPELASMGKIMNLMRFDAYEVSQRFWEFSSLVSQPLGLVFSVVLIWRLIGWPCLIGVVTVFIAQAINALIARALLSWEKDRRIATDNKLHKIGQLVEAIRHLRYYGWQDVWLARIMEARQHELTLRIITALWRILIAFTNSFASGMFPVVAFYAYTVWAGQPLTVDVAFPALQLFSMMETSLREVPNLITVLLNAKVSVARLEEFMSEPEKENADTGQGLNAKLEMKDASFAWPGATKPVLSKVTLSFPTGLTVIYGEVGAGKTALLQALLGELDRLSGEYDRANDPVGYCAQTPWLQSMSIRENILFSSPYEESRYKQVLEACALIPDMANFKHGDLSLVGENGVGLSGGQKARLSLARAVYSRANTLLLDDPLSALDHHTAESIVRKCLSGPLLKDRTAILVTHRTELCLGLADQIVHIVDGEARVVEAESIASQDLHGATPEEPVTEEDPTDEVQQLAAPEKFMEDEHRAHGGVKASIYWEYIKAGKLRWWFVLIIVLALYRVIDVGETWFLKQWGEAYSDRDERATSSPFGNLPNPETNIRPWLIGFFLIAAAQSITYLISQAFMLVIIYQAGKNMFERVMTRVTHATFRFYDVTPVGRLMNRLTSDINTIDGNISNQFQNVAVLSISWISSIVVIGSVTPLFLIFAMALTIAFVVIFMHFLPTSQSLRRLEMVSLSPLISNFGELATGLTSIRAFKVSHLFQARVITVTDNFQKMDHFYWSLQAWLMYRFDNLSAISTFLMTTMALYTGVSPGLTAFLLTAAGKFVLGTHLLCKQYGQLQMDFVSNRPAKSTPQPTGPASTATSSSKNVTIHYAPHLDPALSDISLTIKGGSTTALIGRTGSGKSTLALSLLATTLPSSGRIIIDGIDIATINTQALRKRITFLAQDPILFPGNMRANLDPLDEFSDSECATVLAK